MLTRTYINKVKEIADLLRPHIDEQRWQEVAPKLQQQLRDAREWRDVCLGYFGSFQ